MGPIGFEPIHLKGTVLQTAAALQLDRDPNILVSTNNSAYCKEHLDHALDIGLPSKANDALYNLDFLFHIRNSIPRPALSTHVFYSAGHGTRFRLTHYPNKLDSNYVGTSKKAA